jgi:hypothetical protein
MTVLRTIQTAVGPECLIVTTSGLGATAALRAIRAAVGFECLMVAQDGVRR